MSDDDGRLEVLGRLDDVIVTGGENVDPAAVARVLATHPSVADVVVVGVPDDEWGDAVAAVVVIAAGARALSTADVRAWCNDRLPVAALPRHVVAVDALPMLASGKPDRGAVRQLAYMAAGSARSRQSLPPSVR